jgi:hypothetical protein
MILSFDEFDEFVAASLDELERKQERLRTGYGIGSQTRWYMDLEASKLEFYDGDRLTLVCDVLPIGTFVNEDRSWLWAWANSSIPHPVRRRAERLKGLAKTTGVPVLGLPMLRAHSAIATEIVAMACRELGLHGVYAVPGGPSAQLFLGLEAIRESPLRKSPPRLRLVKG